jgi:hypothetical protein
MINVFPPYLGTITGMMHRYRRKTTVLLIFCLIAGLDSRVNRGKMVP